MAHKRMVFDSQMVFKNLWAAVTLVSLIIMTHFYVFLVARLLEPISLALNAVEWVVAKPVLCNI
jgi:hypothetical protein